MQSRGLELRETRQLTNTEIARELGVSRSTVMFYLGPSHHTRFGRTAKPLPKDAPPRPVAASCKHCGCCDSRISYSARVKGWIYSRECLRCRQARGRHAMSSHLEYDNYLSGGCWVCGDPATCIDHDHGICNSRRTCKKCRRGPACDSCNGALQMDRGPDAHRLIAEKHMVIANRAILCAQALESLVINGA